MGDHRATINKDTAPLDLEIDPYWKEITLHQLAQFLSDYGFTAPDLTVGTYKRIKLYCNKGERPNGARIGEKGSLDAQQRRWMAFWCKNPLAITVNRALSG